MSQPMSVSLGALVAPVKTWSPERDAPDKSFEYIDLSAIDQDRKVIVGAREVSCAEAPSRARQIVAAGDVLVSTVRPNLNGVARVPSDMDGATASTGFCVLRPRPDRLDSAYLFHWVRSPRFIAEMVRRATGASYPAVSDRIVLESHLPLPSVPEQRRIAAILDKADTLRAKRHDTLAQLDSLTQSIFLDMFGDPTTNPKRWRVLALENVAATTSGGTPNRAVSEYFGGGIPWVKSGELHQGVVTATEESLTERGLTESSAKVMPRGTVLVAMYGATVGAVAVLGIEAATNQAICCIAPVNELRADYLVHLLRRLSPSLLAKRVGGAQPNLSQELLRKLSVPVPPTEAQRDFACRIHKVEKLKMHYNASLAELDGLFASAQHRAFQGEL